MSENKEPMLCQCEYDQSKGMQVMCFMCTGKKPLSYFDKAKEHDPNCSFINVDLFGQTSYKSSSSEPGGTTRDEVTMGDAWTVSKSEGITEIRKNGDLVRSTEVTPPVLFPRIKPNDNTEGEEPSIKLTFYSGKLWYSDKAFHVNPTGEALPFPVLGGAYYNQELKKWLPAAYEVVNPEVLEAHCSILAISTKARWGRMVEGGSGGAVKGFVPYVDGDQITLPDGYGIKTEYQVKDLNVIGGWLPISKEIWTKNKAEKRIIATITLPEKPENSGVLYRNSDKSLSVNPVGSWGHTADDFHKSIESAIRKYREMFPNSPFYVLGTCIPSLNSERKTVVEPSESQEEMWKEVADAAWVCTDEVLIKRLSEQFTITRRK